MRWAAQFVTLDHVPKGTLFPWVPVFMAVGIGLWFGLPWEPGFAFYALIAMTILGLAVVWPRSPETLRPLIIAVGCVLLGAGAAGLRLHAVSSPVLGFRYYGPVEGRVIEIDRSQSDDLRITLDRVVLNRVPPERTPRKVRISLHDTGLGVRPEPGLFVMVTAHLSAPPGPSEPGGFDFRQMAYFDQLGAVGYSRTPLLAIAPAEAGAQRVNRLRSRLSDAVMARIPGQAGAFASGAVTGDRSGIDQATVRDLRDSNLSHLLAISGMNMAFITAFVFALTRYGLALVPPVALRVNTKKIAAVASLAVAAFYLALSGANVATERAFVMVAVMLVAVVIDRRALSLRTIAIAAVILLFVRPESLLAPGFQMSFAATTVLIAGFAAVDGRLLRDQFPRWAMPVVMLVLSSVLAGMATAPLAAAHFNRFTEYGLLANLMTVPAMGLLIMPGSVIATMLLPVGLEGIGLLMMEAGSRLILSVAHMVAGWEGAVTGVPTPQPWVIPVLALGVLWVILWSGWGRVVGVLPVILAFAVWSQGARPAVLVSADGAQVGLAGAEGRALSSPRGAGFASRSWLENDGDLKDQASAAARPGFSGPKNERWFVIGKWSAVHLKGRQALAAVPSACKSADLVIVSVAVTANPPGCRIIDEALLTQSGALAIWLLPDGTLRVQPTEAASRMWSSRRSAPQISLARLDLD